jgi:2-iminobutanoate/2-iminopropanoate deaminase
MPHLTFVPATAAADTSADIASQTSMTLARVDERLRSARSSLADALALTVYLRRAADFPAMNDAYRQAFKTAPPTRTTVVTDPLTPGAHLEIAAVGAAAGSDRRVVHPASWMASPNPYSYAIRSGDLLFLSGLIARNGKDNSVVQGDVATQTRAVMENARELLEAAGLSFAHLASARAFLPDLKDFPEFNRVYREFVGAYRPARATVGAALTGPAYRVEVTFVASAAARQAVEIADPPSPNLSAAIRAGNALFVAGMLPEGDALKGDAAAQTKDVLRRLDAVLEKAGFARGDVRHLLLYVTDAEAAEGATAACRGAFDAAKVAMSRVNVALAMAGARVEIMTFAERE